ncbi:MAG: hypothetical protein HQM10_27130 [Candidatus Riflebacteria bacterium]|nr:hypothetical protein [Candidatus Riflebacteria bacterium]
MSIVTNVKLIEEEEYCDFCGNKIVGKHFDNELGIFCSKDCEIWEKNCHKKLLTIYNSLGQSFGIRESAENYVENLPLRGNTGHGFAGEKANHLNDLLSGKNAYHTGVNNQKNGADRLVDGFEIQTKYCKTGSKCINECFDENGKFRYIASDGTPMLIEVPSDKYESAIQSMQDKIKKGKIPGFVDPEKAKDLIKKGAITYEQAKNIAKSCTIQSFVYDAKYGIKLAKTAFGISALITLANLLWRGEKFYDALEQACCVGIKIGGTSWITSIIAAQLGRTGFEVSLRTVTEFMVFNMGPKVSALIANSMRVGKNGIHGAAAMSNVSKLLRGQVISSVVYITIFSVVDFWRLIRGKISRQQAFKNVSILSIDVVGSAGGWYAGAAAGATIGSAIPIIGTGVGGIAGAIICASFSSVVVHKLTKSILDRLIEDDEKKMIKEIEKAFNQLAFDYMLSEEENLDSVEKIVQKEDLGEQLREMYASTNKKAFSYSLIKPILIDITSKRQFVRLPGNEEILEVTKEILENAATEYYESASESNVKSDNTKDNISFIRRYLFGFLIKKKEDIPKFFVLIALIFLIAFIYANNFK